MTRLLADGWAVAANDADGEALEAAGFGPAERVLAVPGDIADEAAAQRVVAATLERFDRLDGGLASNAGIMVRKPVTELSLAEWRRVLDTNLTAAFLLAEHAAGRARSRGCHRHRRLNPGAHVRAGHRILQRQQGGLPSPAPPTRSPADLGPTRRRVNCVSPGCDPHTASR